jgi:hypothetical protein
MFDLPASLQCRGVEAHADSGSHGKGEAKRNDARSRETAVLLSALALGLTALLVSEPLRAQDRTPCLQIKTACEQPGFEQSDVGNSNGLQVNCIRPLMVAVPQRAKSTRPLPQVRRGDHPGVKEEKSELWPAHGRAVRRSDDTTDRPPGPRPAPE